MKPVQLISDDDSGTLGLIACGSTSPAYPSIHNDAYSVAAWDLDHLVLYKDPLHDGWYLAFNTKLGACFHVMFL